VSIINASFLSLPAKIAQVSNFFVVFGYAI